MIQFEMIEIVTGVIAMITFLPSLLIYPGAIIYRQSYALLRDIKPLYVILNHVAAMVFVTHLMLGWKHEDQLRILLEVFQLFGNIFFFGFYVCKHYVLCRRYDTDGATPIPPYVVFTLASGPFVLVSTYRLASSFSAHCYSDLATGLVALIELALVRIKFLVEYHPSPHFKNASRLESVTIFVAAVICVVHQWVDEDPAMVTMIIILALLVNASFIGYIFPPLWTKFRRRDEYTVQSQFNRGEAKRGLLDGSGHGGVGGGAKYYGGAGSSLLNSPLNVETGGIGIVQEKASSNVVVGTESENWFARLACKFIKPKKKQDGGSSRDSEGAFGSSPYKSLDTFPGQSGRNLNGGGGGYSNSHGLHDPDPSHHQRPVSPELKQLLEIINEGDARRVQTFLAHTRLTVLNEGDGRGRTPLHHAVARGDINIIRFLLQMGSDRNQTDAHGYAALHDAVRQSPGQRSGGKSSFYDVSNVICELLDGTGGQMGAMVNLATSGGFTALHFTIMRDQLGALHTLLRYNADPLYNHDKEDPDVPWQEAHTGSSLTFDTCKRSPLMLAVELGLEKHVSSLLRHVQQRRMEIRCPHKLTLLHVALSLGHAKVVEVLIREGRANPMTMHEVSKMTCMHFAALGGSCEAMCLIIDALNLPDILPTELRKDTHNPGGSAAYGGGGSASNRYSPVGSTPKSFRSSRSMSVGLFPKSASFEPSGRSERGIMSGTGLVYPNSSTTGSSSPNTLSGNFVYNNQQRVMTYGEALGLLQRHIPGFIADSERLMAIEGRVDAAVAEARARGQVEEANRLQQAMMILNRRCKSCAPAGSSRENLFFSSSQAAQYTPEGSSINNNPHHLPVRAIDFVTQADSLGMTPMHYAIRQGHLKMITILAATATAGDPESEEDSTPSSHPSVPAKSGDATSSSGRGDGSSAVFILDSRHKSESDHLTSPTNLTESGSHATIVSPQRAHGDDLFEGFGAYGSANNMTNKMEHSDSSAALRSKDRDLSSQFATFAREEHGNVDAQEIMEAIEQGQEIAHQYLKVEETRPKSSPQGTGARNTPVPQGAGTPRESVLTQAAVLGRPPIAPSSQPRAESSLTSYPGSGSFEKRKPSNSPGSGIRSPGDLSHMKFTCEKKTSHSKLRASTPPNGPLGTGGGGRRSPSVSPIGSSQPVGGDTSSSSLPAGLPPLPTKISDDDRQYLRNLTSTSNDEEDVPAVSSLAAGVPDIEVEGTAPRQPSARTLPPPMDDVSEITPPLSEKSNSEPVTARQQERQEEDAASPVMRERTEEGQE